jgi:hypothetical protein
MHKHLFSRSTKSPRKRALLLIWRIEWDVRNSQRQQALRRLNKSESLTSEVDQFRKAIPGSYTCGRAKSGAIMDFLTVVQATEKVASSTNWDAITAIATAAATVATAIMAWFTRKAIREGQAQRKETNEHFAATREQDQRHHEDSFRPLLVLAPSNTSSIDHRENMLTTPGTSGPDPLVRLICSLENIGSGAALNIRLHARSNGILGFGPWVELAPVAANGSYKNASGNVEIPVRLHSSFNNQDLWGLYSSSWILVLEYDDVFGNTFHTLHYKNPMEPWARTGRGSAPDTTPKNISLPLEA